jgi:hypothetical protein
MFADLHRRKELMLLYNLGIPAWRAAAMAMIPGLVMESTLVMLLP